MDGDEIAGINLCRPQSFDDAEVGWVGTLGVRRQWRKRGMGLALLRHSFNEFYRRGKRKVGLGVDAQNLTGALRLYENAGMHVHQAHRPVRKGTATGYGNQCTIPQRINLTIALRSNLSKQPSQGLPKINFQKRRSIHMNIRCAFCQTPYTLSRVAMLDALQEVDSKN